MKHKILIVDDERDIVTVLRLALEKEGYEVSEAYDGKEALEKVPQFKPDLILLDIMMPTMDGYTMNVKLKDNPETANIPVIIITGRGLLKELMKQSKDAAITGYLEKPFTVAKLIVDIKNVFGDKKK
jgi:CheY-like chemotaxis protein